MTICCYAWVVTFERQQGPMIIFLAQAIGPDMHETSGPPIISLFFLFSLHYQNDNPSCHHVEYIKYFFPFGTSAQPLEYVE